jgi:DNA-binding MarR family transcriptional regulator
MTSYDQRPEVERVLDDYRRLVQMLAGARPAEMLLESSVTMAQMKVLMLLSALNEARMSELASALHLSLSTVSGLVDRLVESGLVARRTDANDRRQVMVSLTDEGIGFLDRFQELGVSHLRELIERLSPTDIAAVSRALELLITAAQELPKEDPS